MSLQINQEEVDFDPAIVAAVNDYRTIKAEIKALEERLDIARSAIEAALGDAKTGMINGNPVVRWMPTVRESIDVKAAKELLPPQVLDVLLRKTESRRFTMLTGNEVW